MSLLEFFFMVTKNPQIKAAKRKVLGRKVKKIRREGLLPANLYGRGIKSQNLQVASKDFTQVFRQTGATGILDLIVEGDKKARPVLIQNVQKDPVTANFLHIDFRQVDLTKKITATVPVVVLGEAPGVATGGVLVQLLNEIEVESLPADLPDKITIDVSPLSQIGQSLTIADLQYDKTKVTLKVEDPKMLVTKLDAPTKEEEVKPAAAPVPVEGEAAVPAEGQAEEAKPVEKGAETKPLEKKKEKK